MRSILIIGLTVILSGCVKSPQEMCASYGYSPGTDAFANCSMSIAQQRMQIFQAMEQARAANPPPQAPQIQYLPPMQVPKQTNCITQYIGNQAYTSCN